MTRKPMTSAELKHHIKTLKGLRRGTSELLIKMERRAERAETALAESRAEQPSRNAKLGEPTQEMLMAGRDVLPMAGVFFESDEFISELYKAMRALEPEPEHDDVKEPK